MSQYPSPYTPPPYPTNYHWQPPPGGNPARRAGLLLMILGGAAALFGLCAGAMFMVVPFDKFMAEGAFPPEAINGATPDQMKLRMLITAAVLLVIGAVVVVLGAFVRRGSRGAIITAIVVSGLVGLLGGLNLLGTLALAVLHPSPPFVAAFCMLAVPMALTVLAIVWLIQALRGLSQAQMIQQQYMAQMWHSQQQQAFAPPPSYGYGQQVYPPPPPQMFPPMQQGAPRDAVNSGSGMPQREVRHPPLPPDAGTIGPTDRPQQ